MGGVASGEGGRFCGRTTRPSSGLGAVVSGVVGGGGSSFNSPIRAPVQCVQRRPSRAEQRSVASGSAREWTRAAEAASQLRPGLLGGSPLQGGRPWGSRTHALV